jgi:outer membrane murein-binding lipoprotein Lpp
MEDKEVLLKEIEGKVKSLIADSQKENVKKEDLDKTVNEINEKVKGLTSTEIDTLKTRVDELVKKNEQLEAASKAQGAEMAKMKVGVDPVKPITFREAVKQAILEKKDLVLTNKNDDNGERLSMKDYFTEKGHKSTPVFTIKAVDMLESNIVQSNVANIRLTELDPNRVSIPLTIYPHVMEWMPSKSISKPYMSVLVVYSYSDGAGTKTEGSAPTQSSFLLKTVEFKAFYIATYGTLSDETLDDLPEALDEIAMVFPDKIMDNIDSQILGTAGDDSTALAGLFTANKHTDYSGTAYAAAIAGANMIDLIGIMADEVKASKYRADAVIMNPQEVTKLSQLKDLLNNSISDRRITFDSLGRPVYVNGLRIFESTGITADTMAVVDSKQLIIGKRKDMTLEILYNGTDATEGQKTVVVKVRIAFAVRDKAAVVYSDSVDTDWNALVKV